MIGTFIMKVSDLSFICFFFFANWSLKLNCRCWSRMKEGRPVLCIIDVPIDFVCAYVINYFFFAVNIVDSTWSIEYLELPRVRCIRPG